LRTVEQLLTALLKATSAGKSTYVVAWSLKASQCNDSLEGRGSEFKDSNAFLFFCQETKEKRFLFISLK